MDEKKQIDQKMNDTLSSLAELEDIDAHPYLHAHLQAGISEYEASKENSTYLRVHMRDLRPALLLFLLSFNMIAGIFTVHAWVEDRESSQAAFAEEYILTRDIGDVGSRL